MARKKKHPEHVNHERWLISYADFITLLFAFFVVMFAVSQVDSAKVGRFTESFSKAVGIDTFPESGAGLLPGGAVPIPKPDATRSVLVLAPELEHLKAELVASKHKSELPSSLQILQRRNELVLRLSESLFFAVGDDRPTEPAIGAMRTLAQKLAAREVDVRIEGHTDDTPIRTSRFRSNWELSTARATSVVAILAAAGMSPGHLSAAGYGEFHPVVANDTPESRAQNRRVDIVISVAAPPDPAVPANSATNDANRDATAPASDPSRDAPSPSATPSPATPARPAVSPSPHGPHENHR